MQWLMLQQSEPEDFVIATGVQYSVRDFVIAAAEQLGIKILWKGEGAAEKGYDEAGRCIVAVVLAIIGLPRLRPSWVTPVRHVISWAELQEPLSQNWLQRWFGRIFRRRSVR